MTGHTLSARPTPRARHGARRRSRGPTRGWFIAAGLVVVFVAGAIGLASGLVVLPLAGLLVAAAVRGEARPVIRSGRTVTVAVAMLIGYGVVVAGLAFAGYLHVSWGATGPVSIALQAIAMAVVVLPLALPEGYEASATVLTRRSVALAASGALTITLAHLTGMTYLVLLAAAIGLPPVLIGAAVRPGHRAIHAGLFSLLQALNFVVFWVLVAATTLPATYEILPAAGAVRIVVIAGAAIAAIVSLLPRRRVLVAVNVLVLGCSAFLATELIAIYRSPGGAAVTLSAPFAGDWYVVQGGHSELVNDHRASPSQRDALDIVQTQDGSTHSGAGKELADYYAFDAPLLAPADGVVVYLSDNLPDRPPSSPDPDPAHAEGNQMVIDIGHGRYLNVAHLEQNSALVNVGDQVHQGQALARIGNSGASDEPHLHIQVQNSRRANVHDAGVSTVPIQFRGVTLIRGGQRSHPSAADLRRGDRIHADTWD
jgi:murein DD-endopeptidase MepM/ murein hydrolase activator NlpD